MAPKVVLLLGAGASVADVATRPIRTRPPLDAGFFATSRATHRALVDQVAGYMVDTYALDVSSVGSDSLEGVMARLYPDLFNPLLAATALPAFRALLRLFNVRLADTTNNIRATQKRLLYRMLSHYLANGVAPEDLTIITFNQDLQVEKTLELLGAKQRWRGMSDRIWSFPEVYAAAPGTWKTVSSPSRTSTGGATSELFAVTAFGQPVLRVLKLHGSLNWYSTHTSATPSKSAMFKPTRPLSVMRRRTIEPSMTYTQRRTVYTLPVVIPPVNHKSAVLHNALGPIWRQAEEALRDARQVVIVGYSCPALDFESSNLLSRAQLRRADSHVSVIDPNGAVAMRYIDLLKPSCLHYYDSAREFLKTLE